MKYFELTCMAYLKKDIDFKESFETQAKYISFSMAQDEKLKTLHSKESFKYYVFGGLLPIEKDRVYKRGSTYKFTLRSIDEDFIDILSKNLRENINNPSLQVLQTQKKSINQFFITEALLIGISFLLRLSLKTTLPMEQQRSRRHVCEII